jgi:hypothetical protein
MSFPLFVGISITSIAWGFNSNLTDGFLVWGIGITVFQFLGEVLDLAHGALEERVDR